MTDAETNSVGYLQEFCQKHSLEFPKYGDIDSSGPDHCKQFTYECSFKQYVTRGVSRVKKQAKAEAAKAMVHILKEKGFLDHFNVQNSLRPSNNINHSAEGENVQLENVTDSKTKHPISILNEHCQKSSLSPEFIETSAEGTFICECKVGNKKTYGQRNTKKGAKTEAASKMCVELGIICNGVDNSKSEEETDESNPVGILQELSTRYHSKLEYTELPKIMNLFGVKCMYDSISCEGRGLSKKIAKIQAASEVLKELTVRGVHANRRVKSVQKTTARTRPLEELQLDSSEEEDNITDERNSSEENNIISQAAGQDLEKISVHAKGQVKTAQENNIPVIPTLSKGNKAGNRLEDFPFDSSEEDNTNNKEINATSLAASISHDPNANGQVKSNQKKNVPMVPTLSKSNRIANRLEDFKFDSEEEDNTNDNEKQEVDVGLNVKLEELCLEDSAHNSTAVSSSICKTEEADAVVSVESS